MKYLSIPLLFILATIFSVNSFARKPAVEDFVGVEPEGYQITPQGTEVVYNFGNQLNIKSETQATSASNSTSAWFDVIVLGIFVSFPIFMWFSVTSSVKEEIAQTDTIKEEEPVQTSLPLDENIANLKDYRKAVKENKNDQDKKAS